MCCQFCGAQGCEAVVHPDDEGNRYAYGICCYDQNQYQEFVDAMGLNDDEHLERLAAEAA